MPDMPNDPRQLARDILAGKISIEDLAREQARRRGGQMPAPPQPMNRPMPAGPNRPAPVAIPPIRNIETARQGTVTTPVRRPIPTAPNRPAALPARRAPLRAAPRSAPQPIASDRARPRPAPAPTAAAPLAVPASISSLLRSPQNLRRAVILSEILSPPLALREIN